MLKSGQPCLAKNQRSISVLPIMYKFFSILTSLLIEGGLESKQCRDQAGLRRSYCALDHIFAAVLIQEKSQEWQQEFWLAAADFMEAFDSVEHHSIWTDVQEQGVGQEYTCLLMSLYAGQTRRPAVDIAVQCGPRTYIRVAENTMEQKQLRIRS